MSRFLLGTTCAAMASALVSLKYVRDQYLAVREMAALLRTERRRRAELWAAANMAAAKLGVNILDYARELDECEAFCERVSAFGDDVDEQPRTGDAGSEG